MFNIRTAKAVEFNKVIEFYHTLIDDMQDSPYHPAWEKDIYPTNDYLEDVISKGELYVATDDNKIIAALVLNQNFVDGYNDAPWNVLASKDEILIIHLLAVAYSHQGKGIAKSLVTFATEIAKERNLKAVRLDAMKVNLAAQRLYEGMGFNFIGEMKLFYDDVGLTEFFLYEYPL